jgi:hypothetical protein
VGFFFFKGLITRGDSSRIDSDTCLSLISDRVGEKLSDTLLKTRGLKHTHGTLAPHSLTKVAKHA